MAKKTRKQLKTKKHRYAKRFNPCVELYDVHQHKDFLSKFDCGKSTFNKYLSGKEVQDDLNNGDGVTYIVFDKKMMTKKIVAYYTLAATSIPFISRVKLDPEEAEKKGKEYDDQTYGVNAMQLKMFAVDHKYQNLFFKIGGYDMPISAWVLRSIIDHIDDMSTKVCGVKAIYLHAAEDAENFYLNNEFEYTDEQIIPFASDDDDLKSMFFQLREINICFEK